MRKKIARELLFVLQAQYGIATDSLVATMEIEHLSTIVISILCVMYPQVVASPSSPTDRCLSRIQGDPLSIVIFLTVMNTLSDS